MTIEGVSKELAKREEERPPAPPALLRVTPEAIQETMQSITLLKGMVKELLVRGIDYGRIPGTPQDSLWDPGASMIIGAFNCYPGRRRMIKIEDSDVKIVACFEVPIISRATGQEVGSGIGAASTLETKYKYRWVANPREWGYDEAAMKTFKTKPGKDDDGNEVTLYRIANPEHSELLNTIVKMASKRGEVDAAESLPGVASVLREMFSGKKSSKGGEKAEYEGPRWQRFWGEVRRLGLTDQEAHAALGVISMKDWLAKGRSLEEALDILRGKEPGSPEELQGGGFAIDPTWLKDAKQTLKWTDETMLSFITSQYKVSGKTLAEALNRISREQAEDFVNQINKKVESQRK